LPYAIADAPLVLIGWDPSMIIYVPFVFENFRLLIDFFVCLITQNRKEVIDNINLTILFIQFTQLCSIFANK